MSKIPHGEPYAGKLHVRFDEGADVPCGGVSLYSTPFCFFGTVEDEFDIKFPMKDVVHMKNVGDMVTLILQLSE